MTSDYAFEAGIYPLDVAFTLNSDDLAILFGTSASLKYLCFTNDSVVVD